MTALTEAETLKPLVAAGRDREKAVIDAPSRTTPYSYREFATNTWKAGNLLGHYGARGGTVAVVIGPKTTGEREEKRGRDREGERGTDREQEGFGFVDAAEPLLALLGGTLLGVPVTVVENSGTNGTGTVDPGLADGTEAGDSGLTDGTEAGDSGLSEETRVLVLPWEWVDRYDPPPACSVLAYGGPPTEPSVAHFEAELWSETPVEPPEQVTPADDALRIGGDVYTHGELVAATEQVVEALGLDESSTLGLAAPVTSPGGIVAGVLAPLSVGATIQPVADPEYRGDTDRDSLGESEGVTVVLTDEGEGAGDDERVVSVSAMTELVRDASDL